MRDQTRRSLMKLFAIVPGFIIGGAKSVFGNPTAGSPVATSDDHKRLGVQVMRFLNTAQLWQKVGAGGYALASELASSPAVRDLRDSDQAERHGIGNSLISSLSFDRDEIVPGWSLRLEVFSNRSGYIATIRDVSGPNGAVLSTDHSGVVFEGNPLQAGVGGVSASAAELRTMNGAQPIKASVNSSKTLLRLASITVAMINCCDYSCCDCQIACCHDCTCQCMDGYPGPGTKCWNCGCATCHWCCDIF